MRVWRGCWAASYYHSGFLARAERTVWGAQFQTMLCPRSYLSLSAIDICLCLLLIFVFVFLLHPLTRRRFFWTTNQFNSSLNFGQDYCYKRRKVNANVNSFLPSSLPFLVAICLYLMACCYHRPRRPACSAVCLCCRNLCICLRCNLCLCICVCFVFIAIFVCIWLFNLLLSSTTTAGLLCLLNLRSPCFSGSGGPYAEGTKSGLSGYCNNCF